MQALRRPATCQQPVAAGKELWHGTTTGAACKGCVRARLCHVQQRSAARHCQMHAPRYAPAYDDLDGGSVAGALGFDELRAELLSRVRLA